MLSQLRIQNYALIKALDIDFQSGFTSITGETGAGKSILLGAIGLVMGDRGDSTAILDNTQKCVIEAEFDLSKRGLETEFQIRDIDYTPVCTVRREWHPNGKTRAFINDTPVSVADLKWLGGQLLEIHSQHTGLLVTQAEEQMRLLDAFAGSDSLLDIYRVTRASVVQLQNSINEKTSQLLKIRNDADYQQYLLKELEQFNPNEGEEESLEAEIGLLSQSENLIYALSKSFSIIDGGEGSLLDLTNKLKSELKSYAHLNKDLGELFERINQIAIESKELSRDISISMDNLESNPERLEQLNQRFSSLQQLLRKHGVTTAAELIEKLEVLSSEHAVEHQLENEIQALEITLNEQQASLKDTAQQLHSLRLKHKDLLTQKVLAQLQLLEMPFAQLEIQLTLDGEFHENGSSCISVLFSANKGQQPMPIEKVASGGEISRLNFCLRTIIAELKQLATLIYDEADTGVSGEVANRLGFMMRKQGQHQQIFAITHLPQVAASGNQQLFVFKNHDADISETQIKQLAPHDRIAAIAEMLSGRNPTDAAKLNAQHLLEIQGA